MKINRNKFGQGKKVSLFTVGSMRAVKSLEQMYLVLKSACLAGINHIETAPTYGSAEDFIGESIIKLKSQQIEPKEGWIITSKILPTVQFENGKSQLKNILSRLKMSKIDNLAIHGLNLPEHFDWLINGAGKELVKWAQEENLIGQLGFSSHGSFKLIEDAIKSNQFGFCSLHLHLLDQERIPLVETALNLGMGVMAISPADKGGHLYNPSKTLIQDCWPKTPLEIAYRFLLSKGISTLTLGASKPEDFSLAQKLINSNEPLNELEQNIIDRIANNIKTRVGDTFCGQCRECLPCPQEVPIPELLRLRNLAIGLDLVTFTKERYNLIGRADHWWEKYNGSACANCGDCLPKCPNNLNIPKLLESTHSKLADTPKRRLWG